MDALGQALYARRLTYQGGLIHHRDRGGQHMSIRNRANGKGRHRSCRKGLREILEGYWG